MVAGVGETARSRLGDLHSTGGPTPRLLGGDEDFYDEVDASLKDLELVEDIEDAQKKLFSWRMDFFLDKFKSTYMEDPVSTWTTDGFDDNHCLDTIPMQITLNFDEV